MKRFALMYQRVDQTTRTGEKVAALREYFATAPPEDAAWGLLCLSGRRLLRTVGIKVLRQCAIAETGFPEWMLGECYDAVGDMSETLTLLLPAPGREPDMPLHRVFSELIVPMGQSDAAVSAGYLREAWERLPREQLFVFHKLISGTFRVGVARGLVVRALAEAGGIEADTVAHRLSGNFEPTAEAYRQLLSPRGAQDDVGHPYPFCLAHQLDLSPTTLGEAGEWLAEWKWDGVRAQLIRRGGRTFLWSRGEGVIGEQFPEIVRIGDRLPEGTVLDGEVLAWRVRADGEGPLPFKSLQTRLGRKDLQPSLFDNTMLVYMAFDQLEGGGEDVRSRPFGERRGMLEETVRQVREGRSTLTSQSRGQWHGDVPVRVSPLVTHETWDELAAARAKAAETRESEGLMLKHVASVYHVGRQRGDAAAGDAGWWKWKVDPYTVDAVLVYAQPGSGRRAGLFTDYTFAVWNAGEDAEHRELVPFAKAYSGLTDEEIVKVDAYIRRNTLDRRGPVRFVKPEMVFEIAFQSIHPSTRHRSGVAVRFPRIARWRTDKQAADADTLGNLLKLVSADEAAAPLRKKERVARGSRESARDPKRREQA